LADGVPLLIRAGSCKIQGLQSGRAAWPAGTCGAQPFHFDLVMAASVSIPDRLFQHLEEDEERTSRLVLALEQESTAASFQFALFPRRTRDGAWIL
jgi:hypothetical protein